MDPVADMLTIIRNGYMAKKPEVKVRFSKFKNEIAQVLQKSGYITKVTADPKTLTIVLTYEDKKSKINEIKRISKVGLRVYTTAAQISKVKGGLGTYIISTSSGVMNGEDAKNNKLGGEVICRIW